MKYTFTITFEADSDEEALEQVYGTDDHPEHGARDSFMSIHSERLTREDGSEVA